LLENDEVDVNGGVDLEHGDVLNSGGWAVDIDDSLVDSHLVSVPGVGSFTARRFSGGNSQDFGWNSNWTSSLVSLVLSSNEDLIASPLEWLSLSSLKLNGSRNLFFNKKKSKRFFFHPLNGTAIKKRTFFFIFAASLTKCLCTTDWNWKGFSTEQWTERNPNKLKLY